MFEQFLCWRFPRAPLSALVCTPDPCPPDIRNGRTSLVLGAGASREANFPTADELAQWLSVRAGDPHGTLLSGKPLDYVAQYLYSQRGFGKEWVRRHIIEYFSDLHTKVGRPPSAAHGILPSISWRTLFTTNYDRLVEITYDSSTDAVQRLLPIYAPDPQLDRHERDVVRLVKLNGSVDEAARNVHHELVLTFSEQRDTGIRNSAFYRLLREEAVNGSIVFIGFRFVHPGATLPGTSPEFQKLQDLVREMAGTARWHYCVAPFDMSSVDDRLSVEILRGCNIEVINCKFGEFIAEVRNLVSNQSQPLAARDAVEVPVGLTMIRIDPEEFERDLRHFEVLTTRLETTPAPAVTDSLNGNANWGSFLHGHIIARSSKIELMGMIEAAVASSPEIIYFGAPAGWGKTFLLKDLAVELYLARRPVFWLNPYATVEFAAREGPIRLGSWDAIRMDHLMLGMHDAVVASNLPEATSIPIIIADNCAERAPEVLSLFRALSNKNRKFVIVFSIRDTEMDELAQSYPLLRRARRFEPLGHYDTREEVGRLIEFCTENKVATVDSPAQREIVTERIVSEEADTALILALQIIFDRQHRPFSEIVAEMWNGLSTDIARQVVLRVAALHRFGTAFAPRLFTLFETFALDDRTAAQEGYTECLRKGVLFERMLELEPCVQTLHSLVADRIVSVSGTVPSDLDSLLLELVSHMTPNPIDLEVARRLLKRINDYEITLSSEENNEELFRRTANAMRGDWVVAQQFAKYLLQRNDFELAHSWAERAIYSNPEHAPLQHTRGNVLRKWGMQLLNEGDSFGADEKFALARESFAMSRVTREPDEYGYVTHLDMLHYLLLNEQNPVRKANAQAEGAVLYSEGLRSVPKDKYNLLLEPRFQKAFDVAGKERERLCAQIESAANFGRASVYAVTFLADELFRKGKVDQALGLLQRQRDFLTSGVLLWVKEAELNTRAGKFAEAAKAIDSARRRENEAETSESIWKLLYWNVIISAATGNYPDARTATLRLRSSNYFRGHVFPRGYFWLATARPIAQDQRVFKEHARIFSGRVKDLRPKGTYGQVTLVNAAGDILDLDFNPKYFARKDIRPGDYLRFVITIMPTGLRADDIESKPFINTVDDVYLRS